MDIVIIYCGIMIDFFEKLIFKYSKYVDTINPAVLTSNSFLMSSEARFSYNIGCFTILFYYFLNCIYIYTIVKKCYSKQIIDLKRNTYALFMLLVCDFVLNSMEIKGVIYNHDTLIFVIICLLTNLVVYIKYKKNNIKIK